MTARRVLASAFAASLVLVVGACGKDHKTGQSTAAQKPPAVALSIAPASNATGLPASTEIAPTVSNGTVKSVTLTDDQNAQVTGAMRADGSAWVPDQPLKFRKTYTTTVTANGADGSSATQTSTFSTMADPGKSRVGSRLRFDDGATYGNAMPIVVDFDEAIPEAARAQVEKRLFVTSDPPQPGAWAWLDAESVTYRPPSYWQPGTKITVRSALEGLPIGKRFGDADRRAAGTISTDRVSLEIDNKTKRMTVSKNDQVLKVIPVSLGKSSTPSSSGNMVIMEKYSNIVFNTMTDPNPANRYIVPVNDAQRLTDGGEFIHSAPWSVWDQGRQNVSHGCINVSPSNAAWLMATDRVGDPVTVKNTEARLDVGNGWTAWDLGWADYLKRSASPHPELANAGGKRGNSRPN